MNIIKCLENNILTLFIDGRIDTNTSVLLRDVHESIDYNSINSLVLDFTNVEYITSAGLRELLVIQKKAKNYIVTITNINSTILEIFEMTGFAEILNYTVNEEEKDVVVSDIEKVDICKMSYKEFLTYKQIHGTKEPIICLDTIHYTWKDIEIGSQIIADDLSKLGVKKGTHVGICGRNSLNWVLTFFAIQKLGAIAMLLNFNLTKEEIIKLSHSADITHLCFGQMNAVLNDEDFFNSISGDSSLINVLYDITNNVDFLNRASEYETIKDKFRQKVESDDIAVMIFTSGSTGSPKAVMLSAQNVLTAAKRTAKDLYLTNKDINCMISPMFHISGLGGGLIGNMYNDTKIILPASIKADVILDIIEKEKCTIFNSVPTMMFAIVNHPKFSNEKVKTLRYSKLSGAPITEAQCKMLQEKMPNNHFVASYGMSEIAPITCTLYNDTLEHITTTVGKPVKNVMLKIINPDNGKECPCDVVGEIVVQAENQMLGYYKLPVDRQAINDEGWILTGDLGKMDNEGYVYFTGRVKELIIRGGENISPNEIASVITEVEGVADAKVFGIPDEFYGEIVGAAIVMKEGYIFDELSISSHIQSSLSKYKWPEYYIEYKKFPLLPNGKVNGILLKKDFIEKVENCK